MLRWLSIRRMALARKSAPAPVPDPELSDALIGAVERLADAVIVLRDTVDAVREDISWLSRNGLPVQPIEHVVVKRMARDPAASDWNEQLQTIHLQSSERSSTVDHDVIQKLVEGIKSAFEAIAQGQLELVLTALDGIRTETLAVIGSQPCHASSQEEPPLVPPDPPLQPARDTASSARIKPRRGRLF